MPNLPQQSTIVQYLANGSSTNFTFAFYAPLPTDIQVYQQAQATPPNPAAQIQMLNVDFTVTYNADPTTGGTIIFAVAPVAGNIVTINLQVQASLNTNFANAQNFNGANLDAALDRLLLLCQQNLTYILQRNLSYTINSYLPTLTPFLPNSNAQLQLPILGAQQIWQGNGSGVTAVNLEENPDVSTLRSQLLNEQPSVNGCTIIGYYDPLNLASQTLANFLNNLPSYIAQVVTSASAPIIPRQEYVDSGAVNALAITVTGYAAYHTGDIFQVKAANTNTTSSATLNVNGLGAKSIKIAAGLGAYPKDIVSGYVQTYIYDGINFQLLNPASGISRQAVICSVTLTNPQAFPNGNVDTKVLFDTIYSDDWSMWDATNHQIVAKFTGKWRTNVCINNSHGDPATTWLVSFYINGVIQAFVIGGNYSSTGTPDQIECGNTMLLLNAGDTVTVIVSQGGASGTTIRGNANATFFELEYIGQ